MHKINHSTKYTVAININLIEQLILQKQKAIYEASKKCYFSQIIKLQKHLREDQAYSLIILKKILIFFQKRHGLTDYYVNKTVIYAFFVIRSLRVHKYNIISFFKIKASEYLLYMLLKPEWEARCEISLLTTSSSFKIKNIRTIIGVDSSVRKQKHIRICINYMFICYQRIMQKISSSESISCKLKQWLTSKKHITGNSVDNSHVFVVGTSGLKSLLQTIVTTGLEWHIYTNLKVKTIYKQINYIYQKQAILFAFSCFNFIKLGICIAEFISYLAISANLIDCYQYNNRKYYIYFSNVNISASLLNNLTIRPDEFSIKELFTRVRHTLYHKNKKGLWRVNTDISKQKAQYLLNNLLSAWRSNCCHALDESIVCQLNHDINNLAYIWQKK